MTQTADAVDVTRMSLRNGGWIGYTADAVYLERDDEKIKISNEHVSEVALQTLRWDLAVMSALLIGVGGYVMLIRNPLVGAAFAVIGILSLYRTYTARYQLLVHIENKPKPVKTYPTHPVECHRKLVENIMPDR